jgi:hypothetical protein
METVFFQGIEALKKCADMQAVSNWREQFCETLYERKLGNWDVVRLNP